MSKSSKLPIRIMAIDDDPAILALVQAALERPEVEVTAYQDPDRALDEIRRRRPDIVLLDLTFPGANGMDVLSQILQVDPTIEVVLLTGDYSTESAVAAIKRGACDYLTKPVSMALLQQRVEELIQEAVKRQRVAELERELLDASEFSGMVGRSSAMLEVFATIRRVAPHFQTVLITGATGTGKELVAHALHRLSPRAARPFAVCNCSAIVETLMESELFGHVKGAFTGAVRDQVGLFEYADGGTVFLDEVGDLPLPTQAKLLRVLQNLEIQRVGSPAVRKVDVRVIAATNQNLIELVQQQRFRQDLYYRLTAVEIGLPSLMERQEDLPLLVQHLVARIAKEQGKPIRGLTRRAQAALARYSWPGNVRELENALAHGCMMASGEWIDVRDLPERLIRAQTVLGQEEAPLLPLGEIERRYVHQVLEAVDGNRVRAARILGIGRTTLQRWLREEKGC